MFPTFTLTPVWHLLYTGFALVLRYFYLLHKEYTYSTLTLTLERDPHACLVPNPFPLSYANPVCTSDRHAVSFIHVEAWPLRPCSRHHCCPRRRMKGGRGRRKGRFHNGFAIAQKRGIQGVCELQTARGSNSMNYQRNIQYSDNRIMWTIGLVLTYKC